MFHIRQSVKLKHSQLAFIVLPAATPTALDCWCWCFLRLPQTPSGHICMNKCVFKHILTTLAMYGAQKTRDTGWSRRKGSGVGSWESGELGGWAPRQGTVSQWQIGEPRHFAFSLVCSLPLPTFSDIYIHIYFLCFGQGSHLLYGASPLWLLLQHIKLWKYFTCENSCTAKLQSKQFIN